MHMYYDVIQNRAENAYTQRKRLAEKVHPWVPQDNQNPQESQD